MHCANTGFDPATDWGAGFGVGKAAGDTAAVDILAILALLGRGSEHRDTRAVFAAVGSHLGVNLDVNEFTNARGRRVELVEKVYIV